MFPRLVINKSQICLTHEGCAYERTDKSLLEGRPERPEIGLRIVEVSLVITCRPGSVESLRFQTHVYSVQNDIFDQDLSIKHCCSTSLHRARGTCL